MKGEETISRLVAMSKILGHVYSVDGAALKGVGVACNGVETQTLADGFFVLSGLAPGTHEVRVNLQGYSSMSKPVSIQEGEEVTIDFHLTKATGTAKIQGHVYNEESKRTVEQGGSVMLILPVANKYEHIDRDGYYQFKNLSAGTYKISTSIRGYEDHHITLTIKDDETKTHDFHCKAMQIEEPPWG